jgi:hydroxymethylglutaryl-CoA lyase
MTVIEIVEVAPRDGLQNEPGIFKTAPLPMRVHLHHTRGPGIANAWAAVRVRAGAATLDASIGEIGGCSFAPNASGNIAIEDLPYPLERSGVASGWNLDRTIVAARWLGEQMGRTPPGAVSRAGSLPMRNQ